MSNIKLFESRQIRTVWNEAEQKWYFVVADVVQVLTDTTNPTDYIKKMRKRDELLSQGWGQLVTPLLVDTAGGKQKLNCANAQVASNFRMNPRSYINILTITFCLTIALTSCGQTQDRKSKQSSGNTQSIQIDTSKTAIISFDKKGNYPFDNSFTPTTLAQDDLDSIDSLLIACVTDYNNSLDEDHKEWSIDLKKYNYRKQIIAVINKKGEKEVWVNCFCHTWDNNNWKKDILLVHDGGNCYFNFKVNLVTKKFYELGVNGEA